MDELLVFGAPARSPTPACCAASWEAGAEEPGRVALQPHGAGHRAGAAPPPAHLRRDGRPGVVQGRTGGHAPAGAPGAHRGRPGVRRRALPVPQRRRRAAPRDPPVPSGVESAHYARARALRRPYPRPTAGYVGVVDERLDLDLVAGSPPPCPTGTCASSGRSARSTRRAPQAPNLHYPGWAAYDDLPEVMAGFDAALMPFALNEATRSISPTNAGVPGGRPARGLHAHRRCRGGLRGGRPPRRRRGGGLRRRLPGGGAGAARDRKAAPPSPARRTPSPPRWRRCCDRLATTAGGRQDLSA